MLAGPQGFEPRPTGPKPVVLPLDDGPTGWTAPTRRVGTGRVYPRPPRSVNQTRRGRSFMSFAGRVGKKMAGPQGFEPRPTGPEPVVLPLDDGPARTNTSVWKGRGPRQGPSSRHPLAVDAPQAGRVYSRRSEAGRPGRARGPARRREPWRGAGVVDRDGLENRCVALLHRGFESHPLRQAGRSLEGAAVSCRTPSDRSEPCPSPSSTTR